MSGEFTREQTTPLSLVDAQEVAERQHHMISSKEDGDRTGLAGRGVLVEGRQGSERRSVVWVWGRAEEQGLVLWAAVSHLIQLFPRAL